VTEQRVTKTMSAERMRVHRKGKKLGKTPCQVKVFDGMCLLPSRAVVRQGLVSVRSAARLSQTRLFNFQWRPDCRIDKETFRASAAMSGASAAMSGALSVQQILDCRSTETCLSRFTG